MIELAIINVVLASLGIAVWLQHWRVKHQPFSVWNLVVVATIGILYLFGFSSGQLGCGQIVAVAPTSPAALLILLQGTLTSSQLVLRMVMTAVLVTLILHAIKDLERWNR